MIDSTIKILRPNLIGMQQQQLRVSSRVIEVSLSRTLFLKLFRRAFFIFSPLLLVKALNVLLVVAAGILDF